MRNRGRPCWAWPVPVDDNSARVVAGWMARTGIGCDGLESRRRRRSGTQDFEAVHLRYGRLPAAHHRTPCLVAHGATQSRPANSLGRTGSLRATSVQAAWIVSQETLRFMKGWRVGEGRSWNSLPLATRRNRPGSLLNRRRMACAPDSVERDRARIRENLTLLGTSLQISRIFSCLRFGSLAIARKFSPRDVDSRPKRRKIG
jgi:hypothetical protein